MRIVLILSLLVFNSLPSFAHQDLVFSYNKDNIHLQCKTGWTEFEIGNKLNILTDLTAKLYKSKGCNSEKLFIYFNHSYTHRDSSFYYLSYGNFSYWNQRADGSSEDINDTGLKLYIRDRDIDMKKVLNLINSAVKNLNFIKTNQRQLKLNLKTNVINGERQMDTIFSILPAIVKTYMLSTDPIVDKLIKTKVYRNINKLQESWEIDYYFLNNKFHFFYNREPEKIWNQNLRKYVITQTYDEEDILVVDNILEILGSYNDGHFVFINDSVFYYIPQRNYNDQPPIKVSGPHKVDSIIYGRRPIKKYYHEYSPVERFTLFFDNRNEYKKAIFFPDSNLVISNFDKIEDNFIKGLFSKKSPPDKKNNTTHLVLLIILALSILANIWLLSLKNRNG